MSEEAPQICATNEMALFLSHRPSHTATPVCVDIPVNMSLCHGIGYTKMRLPNLLHHDSLQEVSVQEEILPDTVA